MSGIVIFGAGGFAREVAWLAECVARGNAATAPCCFVERDGSPLIGTALNELPVLGAREARDRFPSARATIAIGDPRLRERIADQALGVGFEFASLVHPNVEMSRFVSFGDGAVVCAGTTLTTNIECGRQVQINLDCTIGHDVILGDFATLAPGVHLSGNVHVERGAYIGTGATIINGEEGAPLRIGAGAVVGAAACVTKDVPPGVTVVGIPARPLGEKR
jgi:sugar O-acyltransferase (sialic acid O-acetyltransferase NeuD family)